MGCCDVHAICPRALYILYIQIHICTPMCASIHLSIHLSIHPSMNPSIHLSIYPSIYLWNEWMTMNDATSDLVFVEWFEKVIFGCWFGSIRSDWNQGTVSLLFPYTVVPVVSKRLSDWKHQWIYDLYIFVFSVLNSEVQPSDLHWKLQFCDDGRCCCTPAKPTELQAAKCVGPLGGKCITQKYTHAESKGVSIYEIYICIILWC